MDVRHPLSRRRFFGGVAAAMGALGLRPSAGLFAQGQTAQFRGGEAEYDAFAKLASNENNFGPPQNVMQAMNHAWKYANRYGYPDGNVIQEIAAHHGVKPENVLLTPGSGEVLEIVGEAFLMGGKKVVGADPTYATVYQHATNIKAEGIKVPLLKNYQQDLDTMISEANKNAATVGLFYLCNPNNPTGMVISAADVRKVVEGIPKTMPILIDEAYHHFVEDPAYGTSVPYVIEGRPVIVARTFSKIAALAAMRVGYAISTPDIIKQLRVYASNSVNVLAKHGAVASLKDTAGQAEVKK
jgi:histidinol-phosphate aminotransferase